MNESGFSIVSFLPATSTGLLLTFAILFLLLIFASPFSEADRRRPIAGIFCRGGGASRPCPGAPGTAPASS